MNKDRFHNALAMTLGYEQIVKEKRYNIIVDDNADDPKVVIKDLNGKILISFNASDAETENQNSHDFNKYTTISFGIDKIFEAVHLAYIQARKNQF